MAQRPISIRIPVADPQSVPEERIVVGVSEAARLLKVSERTVYRMLKSGGLKRGGNTDKAGGSVMHVSVLDSCSGTDVSHSVSKKMSYVSGMATEDDSDLASKKIQSLENQVREKDSQIAQLLVSQQELTRTVQKLQEQMYELAHLVLTHNVAAAQAKAEAELAAQKEQAKNRSVLAVLLKNRSQKP